MDLDDEELKATRKLNGVNKDIERVRTFYFELEDKTGLKLVEKENYDKLVAKIKELEVLEDDLKDKRIVYIDTPEFEENYISKQKVKDKIEELKKEYEIALEENSTKAFILKCKISALEELLEEDKQ
mgnify:CR=1 FL=1